MGKRARKTRWRALDIADDHEQSDSEESNANSAISGRYPRNNNGYNSNGYYSKFPYSSQSTPARRRYQYDGSTKSTRSSSTTSENKITFNEDEYTRITTPRQDVLFKKGYLNKPKNYQTQTSTGTSTISTGNSTENGTPDHQSTDLDYESQFVFPNGFVDQNGIYYVNSYEPYPLMLFNPPTYYHEFSNIKSKRHSTGSLSESMSPNNEEATSQDLSQSGGEASNSVSDYSGRGQPVYNMVFPGYYVNGACTPTDAANEPQHVSEPVKKLRKRRERKSSKTIPGDSSEFEENSSDENTKNSPQHRICLTSNSKELTTTFEENLSDSKDTPKILENGCEISQNNIIEKSKTATENSPSDSLITTNTNGCAETKTDTEENANSDQAQPVSENNETPKQSTLKPDAEEFVPRAYQSLGPPPHIKMFPPNFVPIPLVPVNEYGGPNFNHPAAFISPGIPINFIHHHHGQKMFPPAVPFVAYAPPLLPEAKIEEIEQNEEHPNNEDEKQKEKESTTPPSHTPAVEESKPPTHSKELDMASVVSKLEEAAKRQERKENMVCEDNSNNTTVETKSYRASPRYNRHQNFKRTYYNKYRNSPVRNNELSETYYRSEQSPLRQDSPASYRNSPVRHIVNSQREQIIVDVSQSQVSSENSIEVPQSVQANEKPMKDYAPKHILSSSSIDESKQTRQILEKSPKKIWRPNDYPNNHRNVLESPKRQTNYNMYQNYPNRINSSPAKSMSNGDVNQTSNRNYSETLKRQNSMKSGQEHQKSVIKKEKLLSKSIEITTDSNSKLETTKPRSNQWIPVSGRKKKKGKNFEEAEIFFEEENSVPSEQDSNNADDFEKYDVSELVDVVPSSRPEEKIEDTEKRIEDMLSTIAQNETSEIISSQLTQTDIKILEVSDIEKNIIVQIEQKENIPDKVLNEPIVMETQKETTNENPTTVETQSSEKETKQENKPKKKTKKGTQKPLTRKVIITDIDLSEPIEEKTPLLAPLNLANTKIVEPIKTDVNEEIKPVKENAVKELNIKSEQILKEPEKKPKKKKKNKVQKSNLNQDDSLSSSNTTLNVDDSYDFLLENSLLNESLDKTNDEVSLELDKLIQRGIYNSLQEKIKSIKVEPEMDKFFQTIQSISTRVTKKATSASDLTKNPDFNKIFQSTRQFLKPNMVSVEPDNNDIKIHIDNNKTSSSESSDAAHSTTGPALGEPQEVQEAVETLAETSSESDIKSQDKEDEKDNKTLYPITQAVKEWMNKTREATPEVEILKSPTTLKKEFGNNVKPEDGLAALLDSNLDEDEVTLFSSNETLTQEQPDLLEYWENDLEGFKVNTEPCNEVETVSDGTEICSKNKGCCSKCQNKYIKGDDENIEIYESKYGQNESLLDLQTEVNNKQRNTPRPGTLPYRAVCCSLQ